MDTIQTHGWEGDIAYLGNAAIANQHKTAFLCSRRYPAIAVLRIYDWAKVMRKRGECVVSGFHSPLEQDALDILLRGSQPIILVVSSGLPKRLRPEIRRGIEAQRLLLLSPFPDSAVRVTSAMAHRRNEFVLAIADQVVVGYAGKDGILAKTLATMANYEKIQYLSEST